MILYSMGKSRWNNVTKISLINLFSAFYFYLPYMTLYYQDKGLNLFQINSLSAVMTLTTLLGEIPTGILADKFGRKFSMLMSLVLQFLGELYFIFGNNYLVFFLISVIAGLSWSFRSGCEDALLFDSLKEKMKEKDMAKANGLRLSSALLGGTAGAVIGGLIVSQFGLIYPLLIGLTVITVFIATSVACSLKEPPFMEKNKKEPILSIFRIGFNYLKSHSKLKKVVLFYLFTAPFFQFLLISFPVYFRKAGIPESLFGIAYTAGSILAFLGSRNAYRLEKLLGPRTGLAVAVVLPAIFYLLIGAVFHPIISFVLFCLLFGSMTLQNPIFSDIQNSLIENKFRATILSMINMVSGIYIILMELVIGYFSNISLSLAYFFIGGTILVSSLAFYLGKIELKKK